MRLAQREETKDLVPEAKKKFKACSAGLLDVLALPNTLSTNTLSQSTKPKDGKEYDSRHLKYLVKQGLLSINRQTETLNLIGYLPLMLNTIREEIDNAFPDVIPISPPYFVRAAILEGCNEDLSRYCAYDEGEGSTNHLAFVVGHSLPALLAPFVRTLFSKTTNRWPICLHSTGMAYFAKSGKMDLISCRQREFYVQLVMGMTEEEVQAQLQRTLDILEDFLRNQLLFDLDRRYLSAPELKLNEREAVGIENGGIELVRGSFYGDYISRRLNLQFTDGFLQLGFISVDLFRVLARLMDASVDGAQLPEIFKSSIQSRVIHAKDL